MAHWEKVIGAIKKFKSEIPTLVANEMVNYALDNMREEGFNGVKWKARRSDAPRDKGRRLLMDTGDGERSIRILKKNSKHVELTANEYMEAHNTGATITKTANVRTHRRQRSGKSVDVKAHTRKMNTSLPKRTFIEPSKELDKRIILTLETRFKKLTQ